MASQVIREWVGFQQFPSATQSKLLELIRKSKQERRNTLTVLVMGKGGVGKSSTVNSILGERAVTVSAFQSEIPRPVMVSRSWEEFTLNIIDTPGLVEGGYVNDQVLDLIKRFLLNNTIDVLLYVDRLDSYRVDNLDRQVVKAITDSFGKEIWRRGLVVLTHAQVSPPDGLRYDEFTSRRSEALLKIVRLGARIRKQEVKFCSALFSLRFIQFCYMISSELVMCPPLHHVPMASSIPVVCVENSGRCNKNELDEKILPNGTAWIPSLLQTITDVVLSESNGILVDQKLIEGPNPNNKGKLLIPLISAFQYLFVVKRIQKWIKNDIARESRPSWAAADSKFSAEVESILGVTFGSLGAVTRSKLANLAKEIEGLTKYVQNQDTRIDKIVDKVEGLIDRESSHAPENLQRKDKPVTDFINRWRNASVNCKDRLSKASAIKMCIQGMQWELLYIFQGIKPKSFKELATRAHDMDLSMSSAGKRSAHIHDPQRKKDKQEPKGWGMFIPKNDNKESMNVDVSPVKSLQR
ncbi:Translocase of chloroplast 34, chloroplastic [Capsicum annuum]|nr:Translocase of chloroplast 34, chloroplastic [Capsicum annuum]